jgi:hypothetical protein
VKIPVFFKRARLRVAARYIKMGVVKFPRAGCAQLMTQLLGFGSEKHDDAVDALVYLIGLVLSSPTSAANVAIHRCAERGNGVFTCVWITAVA